MLEWVSRAASEQVYSAAFAWLFSEDSDLPLSQRLDIVRRIIADDEDTLTGSAIDAKTECEDIDLLLTIIQPTGSLVIAIENKIKSTESAMQLESYDKRLSQHGRIRKLFLTLNGEQPRSGIGWRPVSYGALLAAIRAQPNSSKSYVADLCSSIERLAEITVRARSDGGILVAQAFHDSAANVSEISQYMEHLGLHMAVQRMWISELLASLNIIDPWRWRITESNGQSLLDVKAALLEPSGYAIGIQLQSRALKLFCAPDPYPPEAKEEQHSMVQQLLGQLKQSMGLSENIKPTSAKNRGFRSFCIARLPAGRRVEEWVQVVNPAIQRLQSKWLNVRAASN